MTREKFKSAGFDALLAAGVAALAGLAVFQGMATGAASVPGYVMAAALLVRRRHPLWAMGVIAAAALVQVVWLPPRLDPLPYDVAVLIGMYSVVKYARRLWQGFLAAAVVAVGIAIEVGRHGDPDNWFALALWYVGVCGGVWLMAYTVRQRRSYVAGLEDRAATLEREREHLAAIAVADERAAIARELHDVVAHSLAVMIVQADGGRYAFDKDPDRAREALATVASTGRGALEDMRRLVGVLRGSETAPETPRRTITLTELGPLVDGARSAGLDVKLDNGLPEQLPPAVELAVYRIAQEGLTNVLRHAGPGAKVGLCLRHTDRMVTVSVTDDGGTRKVPPQAGHGHGITGMRERVAVHGGTLSAGPVSPAGWALTAEIPV